LTKKGKNYQENFPNFRFLKSGKNESSSCKKIFILMMNRKKLDNSLTIPKISINSINTYLLIGINIMYVVWIAES